MLPLPRPETSAETSPSDADSSYDSSWRRVLILVVITGLGGVVGVFAGDVLSETIFLDSWTLTETLFLVVGLPVGLLLIIALHEGGHTLAGTVSGFRLQHISVGPLKLQHTPEGWRAMRSPHGFFEGMSHSVPGPSLQDAPDQVVRRGRAVRLAGGAAANVLSGGLALGLASILSGGGGATAAALHVFGMVSVVVGVVNLIPFRTGSGLITDGARLVPILRGTPAAGRDVALATVRAAAYSGTRPRDWPERCVERMLSPRDHGMTDGSTRMLAYRHALDAGRTQEARDYLAEALNLLDRLPHAQHAGLMVEAAYVEAVLRGDAEAARSWLQRVDPSTDDVPACALGRAEAATLLAEGEHAEARRRIHDAVAAIDDHPVPGTAVAERAWLHDLQQDVEQGQPYANSPDASPLDANRPHSNPLGTEPS